MAGAAADTVDGVSNTGQISPSGVHIQQGPWRIVLTGGPCGGKTTAQERLRSFFESLGYRVYLARETATILLGGGVSFARLTPEGCYIFQKNLLKTILTIENTFFELAEACPKEKTVILCDRGAMDPSAYMSEEEWKKLLEDLKTDVIDLRDNRYNHVVHLVTAADGAEEYYHLENNNTRTEGLEFAKQLDGRTRNAWLGHPSVDIIDNTDCKNFDDKMLKLMQVVCQRIGINTHDRYAKDSKKRKWLVESFDETQFPKGMQTFFVQHDYLFSDEGEGAQYRIRKRWQQGTKGNLYTLTRREFVSSTKDTVETRHSLTERDYHQHLKLMRDTTRVSVHKKRHCFSHGMQFYNLDCYVAPLPPVCQGRPLIVLETYTTLPPGESLPLPPFIKVVREVTGEAAYSMYMLSKKTPEERPLEFRGDLESAIFADD